MGDARDVQAASGDVGGDQDLVLAALEPVQGLDALALAAVGVHDADPVALLDQAGRDAVGAHAGAAEDEDALELGALQEDLQELELLRGHDGIEAVGDRVRGGVRAADLDLGGIAQGPAGELLDLRRQGRREEEGLAVGGALLDDPLDVRQEAHVEHPVDLVQDQDVDLLKGAVALLQVVQEATRRRREDVHAALQVIGLLPVADAPVDDRHPQVRELGVLVEGFLDLERELAGGLEDQAAHRAVGAEPLDDRERKGGGLAGAGLGGPDHVPARKDQRDRLGLDRGRVGVALLLDGKGERVGEAKLREGGVHLRDVHRHGRLERHLGRVLEIVAGGARAAAVGATGGAGPHGTPSQGTPLLKPGPLLLGLALGGAALAGPPGALGARTLALRAGLPLGAGSLGLCGFPRRGPVVRAGRAVGRGRFRLLGRGYRFTKPGNELP